jgi:hypothetical protein
MSILTVTSCKKKEDEKTQITKEQLAAEMDRTSEEISEIDQQFLPESLKESETALLEGNPCADSDGFFDCQPELLKVYLGIAKGMTEVLVDMTEFTTTFASYLNPGAVGTYDIPEEEQDGIASIEYDFQSINDYKVRLLDANGDAVIYMHGTRDADGQGTYEMYLNATTLEGMELSAAQEDSLVRFYAEYLGADEMSVDVSIINMACEDDDIRAPGKMRIVVDKSDEIWTGKTMMYHPRFGGSDQDDCSLEVNEDTELSMNTEFVGGEDNATAALYMAPTTVDSADDLEESYNISDFCTNFPASCSSGMGFGDPNPVSSYLNPYCIESGETTWNIECEDYPESEFMNDSRWILPKEMSTYTFEMPNSFL